MSISIEGLSRDEAIIQLVTEEGLSLKEAKAFYKDNKPAPRPSFKSRFYAELAESPMSEARFEEVITEEGGNVEAHKSAHRLVFELSIEIFA